MTYLLLKLVFKFYELIEELGVNVLNALDTLEVDLSLQVFLGNLLPKLLGSVHALQTLRLLQS